MAQLHLDFLRLGPYTCWAASATGLLRLVLMALQGQTLHHVPKLELCPHPTSLRLLPISSQSLNTLAKIRAGPSSLVFLPTFNQTDDL